MNQGRYLFSTNETFLDFEFESQGPNGKIKKVVRFSPQNADGTTYFNLAFGNWNEVTNSIDNTAVSNNKDRDKILATVAATVLEFTNHFPDIPVFAKGSTQARTRLYQMGISANLEEIETILEIVGLSSNGWEPFRRNVNYQAFLARRKQK